MRIFKKKPPEAAPTDPIRSGPVSVPPIADVLEAISEQQKKERPDEQRLLCPICLQPDCPYGIYLERMKGK